MYLKIPKKTNVKMCKYGIHSVNYHLKKQNKKKNAKNYIMFKKSSDIYFSKDEYTLIQYIIRSHVIYYTEILNFCVIKLYNIGRIMSKK